MDAAGVCWGLWGWAWSEWPVLWAASYPYEWDEVFTLVHHIGMCTLLGLA